MLIRDALRRVALVMSVCFVLVGAMPSVAQFREPPLDAPVLAWTNAAQDAIWLYDVRNDTTRQLSFGVGEHFVWDFSPDSCSVLFTLSDATTPSRIYRAGLDGADMRALVTYDELPPSAWRAWSPQWSPDGEKIAFVISRDLPNDNRERWDYRIAWVDAAGGNPTYYSITGDEHSPQWSPDGAWLAYLAYDQRLPGSDYASTAEPAAETANLPESAYLREADLWMINASGERKFRLTYFDTGSVNMPRWSPDGNLIGFVYSPLGNNDQVWMVANQGGAIPTQLSVQWALMLDLTWKPDNTAMLAAMRDMQGVAENRLWQIPLVGNADVDAIQYLNDPTLTHADYPRFSADGRWLAFRSAYQLVLLDTQTGESRVIASGDELGNTPPVWTRAGFDGETQCLSPLNTP